MAKAELDKLLDKLSGRLTGSSKFYTTHRHGKTIVSNYPLHRDPKKTTAGQRANSNAFGRAVTLCKQEMTNPERLAYWTERYEAYKKAAENNKAYSTLRGFIIGQLRVQPQETE